MRRRESGWHIWLGMGGIWLGLWPLWLGVAKARAGFGFADYGPPLVLGMIVTAGVCALSTWISRRNSN